MNSQLSELKKQYQIQTKSHLNENEKLKQKTMHQNTVLEKELLSLKALLGYKSVEIDNLKEKINGVEKEKINSQNVHLSACCPTHLLVRDKLETNAKFRLSYCSNTPTAEKPLHAGSKTFPYKARS